MRGFLELFGALGAGSLVFSPVQAQEVLLELAPSSDWVMNYDDDSCALQRQFGEEGQRVFLEMRRYGPGDGMQVVVASRDFAAQSNRFGFGLHPVDQQPATILSPFSLSYGDGLDGVLFQYSLARSDPDYSQVYDDFVRASPMLEDRHRDMLARAQQLNRELADPDVRLRQQKWRELNRIVTADEYQVIQRQTASAFERSGAYRAMVSQRAAAADGMVLAGRFEVPLMLRTGSLRAPMQAMDDCVGELMGHWGIDVAAHGSLSRSATPVDYDRLVRAVQRDFPNSMLGRQTPGYVNLRINVSTAGEPTACHVQAEMSDEAYRRRACDNMMEFARFAPALDASGQAIASVFQISVAYMAN